MKTRLTRLRKHISVVAGAAFVFWLASSALVAWKLTHRERPPFTEQVPDWATGRIEDVRIATSDGERLGSWFLPVPGARTAVLLLHGNGGSRSSRSPLARFLHERDLTVLAPSLRAHGDSSGEANDFGWSARNDVLACVAFLERRAPGARIVVCGASLGAVAAIYAASDLGHRVSAYVLESPYCDLRSAVWNRIRTFLPPLLDHVAYAGLLLWAPCMLVPGLDDLRPIDRIAGIPKDVPVVFLSGTADRFAPIEEVEAIRAKCVGTARLETFPGVAHVDLAWADPSRYQRILLGAIEASSR